MRFQYIQKMAKDLGVNAYRMKKTDLIRAIQRAEKSVDCYGTARVGVCGEYTCLWRKDCLSLNMAKLAA